MARMRVKKIKFVSKGFADVLTSSGDDGAVASAARSAAQEQEGATGVAYEVRKDESWDGRAAYLAKPVDEESPSGVSDGEGKPARRSSLTHEEWMRDVWPRVGGPKWRPHS